MDRLPRRSALERLCDPRRAVAFRQARSARRRADRRQLSAGRRHRGGPSAARGPSGAANPWSLFAVRPRPAVRRRGRTLSRRCASARLGFRARARARHHAAEPAATRCSSYPSSIISSIAAKSSRSTAAGGSRPDRRLSQDGHSARSARNDRSGRSIASPRRSSACSRRRARSASSSPPRPSPAPWASTRPTSSRPARNLARKGQVLSADGVDEWPDGTVSGRYAFLHALLSGSPLRAACAGRRATLHRQLGEALEAGYAGRTSEIAAVLALHFEEGRDFERAARYLAEAADSLDQAVRQSRGRRLSHPRPRPRRPPARRARRGVDGAPRAAASARLGLAAPAGDLAGSLADIGRMAACAGEAGEPLVEVNGLLDLSRFCLYVDRRRCLELAAAGADQERGAGRRHRQALARGNHAESEPDAQRMARRRRRSLRRGPARARPARAIRESSLRRCSIECGAALSDLGLSRLLRVAAKLGQDMAKAIGDVYYFVAVQSARSCSPISISANGASCCRASTAALGIDRAQRQPSGDGPFASCRSPSSRRRRSTTPARSSAPRPRSISEVERNPFNFFLGRTSARQGPSRSARL